MITIIAEKPSVAREYARIVGARQLREGYYDGGSLHGEPCCVTWAIGHLVKIGSPLAEGRWTLSDLPILPDTFELSPGVSVKSGGRPDEGYVRQLKAIKGLYERSSCVVNGGDCGREGELIQRYVMQYVGYRGPVKRLWISSLTDKAIREGLDRLRPGSEFDSLYLSARSRSEADWIVGINATRALTVKAGTDRTLSLGRVQTPTLAMVCSRYLENRSFRPTPFWSIGVRSRSGAAEFTLSGERCTDRDRAEDDLMRVRQAGLVTVTGVEKRERTVQPPLPYDLTALQKEANSRYSMSADETLSTAQALYEKKVMTYPRTGSRYITDDVLETIPALLRMLEGHPLYGRHAAALGGTRLPRRCVDESKVTDHHALLVTENRPSGLSETEQRIYDMVASRMIEAFSAPCRQEVTTVGAVSGGVSLAAKGTVTLSPGWKAVRGLKEQPQDGGEDEQDDSQELPEMHEGQQLPVIEAVLKEGMTKPRPLHTEASLLAAMESAGKEVEDEAAREAMKDVGIGTPATRASIIETLFRRQYVKKDGRKLIPTELGLSVYALVRDKDIASVAYTGEWERRLNLIADGKDSPEDFDGAIRDYAREIVADIAGSDIAQRMAAATSADTLRCPLCGAEVRLWDTNAKCTGKACGLSVSREQHGKRLSDGDMKALVAKGRTRTMQGFVGKSGKTYAAALALKTVERDGRTYGNTELIFDDGPKKGSGSRAALPKAKRR